MATRRKSKKRNGNGANLGFEAQLRAAADALRNNMDAAEHKHEDVRAHLPTIVKRILGKYGYPPDKQEKATRTGLDKAEVLSAGWAVG